MPGLVNTCVSRVQCWIGGSLVPRNLLRPVDAQVLGPLLLPEELDVIFGRVTSLFARLLADAFQRLDPRVS